MSGKPVSWKVVALLIAPAYAAVACAIWWGYRRVEVQDQEQMSRVVRALGRQSMTLAISGGAPRTPRAADLRYAADDLRLGAAKPGERRLVAVGDSIVEFWSLNRALTGTGYTVINHGISGQITDEVLARFSADALQLKPAVVLISAGINDAWHGTPAPVTAAHLIGMAELARQSGAAVLLGSVPPIGGSEDARRVIEANRRIRRVNELLAGYCAARGCRLARFDRALGKDGRSIERRHADAFHPNADGYEAMRRELLSVLPSAVAAR